MIRDSHFNLYYLYSSTNTNDCDSYRLLYEGQENTNIESHNSLGVAADTISACISFTIRKYAKTAKKLADLGGGCGFIVSAITKRKTVN